MLEKSKEIACQNIFDETKSMIKDGSKVEQLQKDFDKALQEKEDELKNLQKETEELVRQMDKIGDFSSVNNGFYTKEDIDKMAKTDLTEYVTMASDDEKNELTKERARFYGDAKNKWDLKNFDAQSDVINKVLTDDAVAAELDKIEDNDEKTAVTNAVKNYALAAVLAKEADLKKKSQYLCPFDLQILRTNIDEILRGKIAGSNSAGETQITVSPKLKNKVGKNFNWDVVFNNRELKLDKNQMFAVANEWAYTFNSEISKYGDKEANKDAKNEGKKYVMTFDEFVLEKYNWK